MQVNMLYMDGVGYTLQWVPSTTHILESHQFQLVALQTFNSKWIESLDHLGQINISPT